MSNPENAPNGGPNVVRAAPPYDPGRNPYEVTLGISAGLAFIIGLVISGVAAGKSITFMGEVNTTALAWATFGNQLSTVGVVVLLGMAFYFMTRWNKKHEV